MNALNVGFRGATAQSWSKKNPRDLLKRVVDENPGATRDELFEEVLRKLYADEALVEVALEYWFTNNYNSLIAMERRPVDHAKRVAAIKSQIAKGIRAAAKIVLLDMVLPNGKALRACSGRECRVQSKRLGPWLNAVADQLKPSQIVGEHLKEDVLQRLYSTPSRTRKAVKK